MKIVVASDSFKGSLSSREVGKAVREAFPDDEVTVVPAADGGEGTVEALGGERVEKTVQDPLGRPVKAAYGWIGERRLAIIETAAASGLTLLTAEQRNPLTTSTYGTGELIRDALEKGAASILLGLGGSATHDAGTGLLEALGWQFPDEDGNPLKGCGGNLSRIRKIVKGTLPCPLLLACDVQTRLPEAAEVFAPQKGADPDAVRILTEGTAHFAKLLGEDAETVPGGGAAGGIAATLHVLTGARISRGADLVLEAAGFDAALDGADLVITGEGRIDAQTPLGKVPAAVSARSRRKGVPVLALCGTLVPCAEVERLGFQEILPITPEGTPLETALRKDFARERIRAVLTSFRAGRYPGHPSRCGASGPGLK